MIGREVDPLVARPVPEHGLQRGAQEMLQTHGLCRREVGINELVRALRIHQVGQQLTASVISKTSLTESSSSCTLWARK
jgi:hypothetical protein